jgi:hypothetical protein
MPALEALAGAATKGYVPGSDRKYCLILNTLQAEGEGNGSGTTCKFTDHASNAVHGSVAEHEFDLDW